MTVSYMYFSRKSVSYTTYSNEKDAFDCDELNNKVYEYTERYVDFETNELRTSTNVITSDFFDNIIDGVHYCKGNVLIDKKGETIDAKIIRTSKQEQRYANGVKYTVTVYYNLMGIGRHYANTYVKFVIPSNSKFVIYGANKQEITTVECEEETTYSLLSFVALGSKVSPSTYNAYWNFNNIFYLYNHTTRSMTLCYNPFDEGKADEHEYSLTRINVYPLNDIDNTEQARVLEYRQLVENVDEQHRWFSLMYLALGYWIEDFSLGSTIYSKISVDNTIFANYKPIVDSFVKGDEIVISCKDNKFEGYRYAYPKWYVNGEYVEDTINEVDPRYSFFEYTLTGDTEIKLEFYNEQGELLAENSFTLLAYIRPLVVLSYNSDQLSTDYEITLTAQGKVTDEHDPTYQIQGYKWFKDGVEVATTSTYKPTKKGYYSVLCYTDNNIVSQTVGVTIKGIEVENPCIFINTDLELIYKVNGVETNVIYWKDNLYRLDLNSLNVKIDVYDKLGNLLMSLEDLEDCDQMIFDINSEDFFDISNAPTIIPNNVIFVESSSDSSNTLEYTVDGETFEIEKTDEYFEIDLDTIDSNSISINGVEYDVEDVKNGKGIIDTSTNTVKENIRSTLYFKYSGSTQLTFKIASSNGTFKGVLSDEWITDFIELTEKNADGLYEVDLNDYNANAFNVNLRFNIGCNIYGNLSVCTIRKLVFDLDNGGWYFYPSDSVSLKNPKNYIGYYYVTNNKSDYVYSLGYTMPSINSDLYIKTSSTSPMSIGVASLNGVSDDSISLDTTNAKGYVYTNTYLTYADGYLYFDTSNINTSNMSVSLPNGNVISGDFTNILANGGCISENGYVIPSKKYANAYNLDEVVIKKSPYATSSGGYSYNGLSGVRGIGETNGINKICYSNANCNANSISAKVTVNGVEYDIHMIWDQYHNVYKGSVSNELMDIINNNEVKIEFKDDSNLLDCIGGDLGFEISNGLVYDSDIDQFMWKVIEDKIIDKTRLALYDTKLKEYIDDWKSKVSSNTIDDLFQS